MEKQTEIIADIAEDFVAHAAKRGLAEAWSEHGARLVAQVVIRDMAAMTRKLQNDERR